MAYLSVINVLFFISTLYSSVLFAEDNQQVTLRGSLVDPPSCLINGGATIDVDFGDRVGVNKVDGVNYEKSWIYLITCEPGATGLDLTLTMTGTATSYDTAAIATDVTNLGIHISQNGKPFLLNTRLPVDPNNPPTLSAVPVKKPGAVLKEGAFVATATLQAAYQ